MWSTFWTLSPVLMGCLILSGATPSGQRNRREDVRTESQSRKEQTPAVAAPANNFGIKFVPLFSLIATYIPKILGRFGNFTRITSSRTDARFTREINEAKINGFFCSAKNFGTWKDPKDCRQFYTCKENKNISENIHGNIGQHNRTLFPHSTRLEVISQGHMSLEHHRCIPDYVYSEMTSACERRGKTET